MSELNRKYFKSPIDNHGRHLVTIRIVDSVNPIENSDNLEVVTLLNLGWKVVAKKGEFHPGDLVFYFEIDSAIRCSKDINHLLPCMEFLKDRCLNKFTNGKGTIFEEIVRIRTMKLRGVVSQGLIIPFDAIFKDMPIEWTEGPEGEKYTLVFDEGTDWTDFLRVEHFDELKDHFDELCGHAKAPDTKGPWPSFVPKTDEERLQSLMNYFDEYKDMKFEITEKFDGSSMTVVYAPNYRADDPFYLCSRNLEKKQDETSDWWKLVLDSGLVDRLPSLVGNCRNLAFQGELVGLGMNGNRDHYQERHWKIFRIWDIDANRFLTPSERYELCDQLGLEHVKVIDKECVVFQKYPTLDDFLKLVEGKTDHGYEREGMVFKSVTDGRISFKVINNKYLLKNEL